MFSNHPELSIINEVEELLGIPVYLVGGAVRDILLGNQVKDWDFTTPASPDEIEESIRRAKHKPYLIGKKFGTIGFKFIPNDVSFKNTPVYVEITTFRKEIYQEKSRKPQVSFISNIQQDLGRRDFTINSMAIKSNLQLIDPWSGKDDLEKGIIRAVDNPKIRFSEDPLRILRAIRFASRFDFEIEENTWNKLMQCKFELLNISRERWVMELDKIIGQENPLKGLNLLMDSGVLSVMIPELTIQKGYDQNTPYHDFDLWTHTSKVVCSIPCTELELRWTGLLHDIAKPFTRTENKNGNSNYLGHDVVGAEMAKRYCQYLKFSNARTEYIVENVANHLKPESPLKQYDDMSKKVA